ncbi:MAG: hypothetical protein ACK56I_01580, partial [bacterium]
IQPLEIGASLDGVERDIPSHGAAEGIEAPDARRPAALVGDGMAFVDHERAGVGRDRGEIGHRARLTPPAAATDGARPELVARVDIDGAHAMAFADEDPTVEHRGQGDHEVGG